MIDYDAYLMARQGHQPPEYVEDTAPVEVSEQC